MSLRSKRSSTLRIVDRSIRKSKANQKTKSHKKPAPKSTHHSIALAFLLRLHLVQQCRALTTDHWPSRKRRRRRGRMDSRWHHRPTNSHLVVLGNCCFALLYCWNAQHFRSKCFLSSTTASSSSFIFLLKRLPNNWSLFCFFFFAFDRFPLLVFFAIFCSLFIFIIVPVVWSAFINLIAGPTQNIYRLCRHKSAKAPFYKHNGRYPLVHPSLTEN